MKPNKPHPPIFICHFLGHGEKLERFIVDHPNFKEVNLFRVVTNDSERVTYGYSWVDSRTMSPASDKWCVKTINTIQELAGEVLNLILWHPEIFPEKTESLKPLFVSNPNYFSFRREGHVGGIGWPDQVCFGLTNRGLETFWKTFLDLAQKNLS